MQVEKSSVAVEPEISVEIGDRGVKRVVIYADTPEQQASAHRLLAAVSLQMVQLDQALRGK